MAKFPKIVALEQVVSEMLANLRIWQTQHVPFEIAEDESNARETVKALNQLIVWASTFEGLVWPEGSAWGLDQMVSFIEQMDRRLKGVELRGKKPTIKPYGELLPGQARIHWFKAYTNWVNDLEADPLPNGNNFPFVPCHPIVCGEEDEDTDVLIGLPRIGFGQPNVKDDDTIGAIRIVHEFEQDIQWACVTAYMDDEFGTVKEWYKPYSIADSEPPPPGWQICDGADDPQGDAVPDLRGRFKVAWYNDPVPDEFGYISGLGLQTDDLGNEGDYEAPGETAGDWFHDHDDHACHTHDTASVVKTWVDGEPCTLIQHGPEPPMEHSNEDHRPPWFVIPSIIRVDNSYLAP